MAIGCNGSQALPVQSFGLGLAGTIVAPTASHRHIQGFDGLRAIAVAMVTLFHLEVAGFKFGWLGVNFFFVLSGFLITSILLATKTRPDYFRRFYIRRSLRIFPIYYLVLGSICAVGIVRHWPVGDWGWFAIYLQNWKLAFAPGIDFPNMFAHTWTLACEEQFYVVWPVVVYLLGRRQFAVVIAALIVLGPVSRALALGFSGNHWAPISPLPSVVDSLAWGAAGAAWLSGASSDQRLATTRAARRWLQVLSLGCAALMLALNAGVFGNNDELVIRLGLVTVVNVLFLALLLSLSENGTATQCLEVTPLRYLGKISYGIYLYHWPVLHCTDLGLMHWKIAPGSGGAMAIVVFKIALTIAIAVLSFEMVERRFLNLKDSLSK
jgi:peptidoglycan/LPS O-acetylase OafA/YrhL